MIHIVQVRQVQIPEIQFLIDLSEKESLSFLKRFKAQYISGDNRFEEEGEILYFALMEEQLVGLCGVNIDPYLKDPHICRLRHLYVHPLHRRKGIGTDLVKQCIEHAKDHFRLMTLRTFDESAQKFYEALGFEQEHLVYSASAYKYLDDDRYLPENYIDKIQSGEYEITT